MVRGVSRILKRILGAWPRSRCGMRARDPLHLSAYKLLRVNELRLAESGRWRPTFSPRAPPCDHPRVAEAPGTLHVVATPLGNLEDITLRAVRVLGEVALIACEDTRRTARLLKAHGIATPTLSYFEHNERWRGARILEALRAGRSVALVADAGTPGLSDPGYRLV